jgi:hypothetical protein
VTLDVRRARRSAGPELASCTRHAASGSGVVSAAGFRVTDVVAYYRGAAKIQVATLVLDLDPGEG